MSDDSPIINTRRLADSGGNMKGGLAHVGSVGKTMATRSCTNWRASVRSVPRSNSSMIEESWATDFDRMTCNRGRPAMASSSGTVTSASTSSGNRPALGVWISTKGGANSGKTSTGI